MRNLLPWLGAAILRQPFYTQEIQTIGLVLTALRHRMPMPRPTRTLPTARLPRR